MSEYDDNVFMALVENLRSVIEEILDMDGNDAELVREEVENILRDSA